LDPKRYVEVVPRLHATATDFVLHTLRKEILGGRHAPGSTLRQEELAERLGVSRMPVREALKRLEAEGLVDVLPSRRVRVAPLSPDEVRDVYDLRAVLEPLAIRLAVPCLRSTHLRDAEHALGEAAEEGDPTTFGARNTRFHLALMEPCERPRLLTIVTSLLDVSDRYQRAALHDEVHNDLVRDEHDRLLAAAREGDADAAAHAAAEHVARAGERVMAIFAEPAT
jgi:DNA-binding GntR family transcriptional regulator